MRERTYQPTITDANGRVYGFAAGTEEDHARAEREAVAERERRGPGLAEEAEILKLTGMPEYNDVDHTSPWVALRALGFPRPQSPSIITTNGRDTYGPLRWDRERVRQWLEHYDAVSGTIQEAKKRHRFFQR